MIVHVAAFRWKPDHDPAMVAVLAEILSRVPAELPDVLVHLWYGPDLRLRPGNSDFAVVAVLRDEAAVATYFENPTHASGIGLAMPMIAERMAVQFEIPEEAAAWLAAPVIAPAQLGLAPAGSPQVGQPGKDVVWVPTPESVVQKILTMAKVTSSDLVVDLGSGDGRTVIAAARRFGARAIGIEYDAELVAVSKRNAEIAGVANKVQFKREDIFTTNFDAATVVTLYLLPELNLRLRPRLIAMKPGTRIVSHQFSMGDWLPDERAEVEGRAVMMWFVPPKVTGNWSLAFSTRNNTSTYYLAVTQTFQRLAGSVRQAEFGTTLQDARLRGNDIVFWFNDRNQVRRHFIGRVVAADRMEGTLDSTLSAEVRWVAQRRG